MDFFIGTVLGNFFGFFAYEQVQSLLEKCKNSTIEREDCSFPGFSFENDPDDDASKFVVLELFKKELQGIHRNFPYQNPLLVGTFYIKNGYLILERSEKSEDNLLIDLTRKMSMTEVTL